MTPDRINRAIRACDDIQAACQRIDTIIAEGQRELAAWREELAAREAESNQSDVRSP